MNYVSELSDFNSIIGAKETAEAFIEMTVHQIDSACFRDMYMNTMEAQFELTDEDRASIYEDSTTMLEGATDPDLAMEMLETDLIGPETAPVEEGGCSSCGKTGESCECGSDPNCIKTINTIPASDPSDAATFFSMTNKTSAGDVVSPKATQMVKEQIDYINAVVPDTIIEGSSNAKNGSVGSDDPRDKVGDTKEDGTKGTLTEESFGDPDFIDLDTMLL